MKETGLFKTQYADGILGLDNNSEFIQSIERNNGNGVQKMSFGLCFHNPGGFMSVDLRNNNTAGDRQQLLNKNISELKNVLRVPYNASNNYYEIPLDEISVGR